MELIKFILMALSWAYQSLPSLLDTFGKTTRQVFNVLYPIITNVPYSITSKAWTISNPWLEQQTFYIGKVQAQTIWLVFTSIKLSNFMS